MNLDGFPKFDLAIYPFYFQLFAVLFPVPFFSLLSKPLLAAFRPLRQEISEMHLDIGIACLHSQILQK